MKRVLLLAVLIAALLPASAHAAADRFAEGCPAETLKEGAAAGLNHNPAAKKAIVPAGATSLRICRYWGFGNEKGQQTPKTQARAGKLNDQAEVHNVPLLEGLTDESKELVPAPKGPISCPFDDGTELYAVFFYAHAEPVILHVSLEGCRFVSGAAPRARDLTESLQNKLVRLAKGERVKAEPKHHAVSTLPNSCRAKSAEATCRSPASKAPPARSRRASRARAKANASTSGRHPASKKRWKKKSAKKLRKPKRASARAGRRATHQSGPDRRTLRRRG